MKPISFIVVWDDEMGTCCPMTWSDECEGAIHAGTGAVALFGSRKEARAAILISTRFAQLRAAQGGIVNTDFTEGKNCIRVVPCAPAKHAPTMAL